MAATPRSPPLAGSMGRLSLDSDRTSSPAPLENGQNGNGKANGHANGNEQDDENLDPLTKLQRELERTREERDNNAAMYQNLFAKVKEMRSTLGNKLKQDAEELDRRQTEIDTLTTELNDLHSSFNTLQNELETSNAECESLTTEISSLRGSAKEALSLRDTLERTKTDLEYARTETDRYRLEADRVRAEREKMRIEKEDWERVAMSERVRTEEVRTEMGRLERELEGEREVGERWRVQIEDEKEKVANLEAVLQDFQAAKDHELRQAVKDYEAQLTAATQSLAEFKSRALNAELQLEETHTTSSRTQELEKEVKEKNLLIGKLRHEAVILNDHLIQALRRLRRTSTETTVDARLITNVLLQFLTTPRTDGKRFEMLNLLASILNWGDTEREKAGLMRSGGTGVGSALWGRSPTGGGVGKSPELEKSDETESFSRLWVEFLLTEAASGESPQPSKGNNSLPGTPTAGSFPNNTATSPSKSPPVLLGTRRLASFGASTPNLLPPPSRKGKEKARDFS
ncbi:hypothetical protein BDQ17DRAFT_1347230 [Cyathus striatus]|nr:hypothetical protein BDQ17DRAFT_1347230 [Cyathus striatus]